jgi:hypothetical protein
MFIQLFKTLSNYEYIVNSRPIWAKSHLKLFQFFLTMSVHLLFNNIANIVYAILSSVIDLQLLHFNLSPLLYNGHIQLNWKFFFILHFKN